MKMPQFDKLPAKLSKLSKQEKAFLFVAIIAVGVSLVDRVIVRALWTRIRELDGKIEAREAGIRKDLKIMAQKQRIEIQQTKYRPFLGAQPTENEEFTLFLKEVDTLARDSGIYVVDMKPTGTKQAGDSVKYMVNLNVEAEMGALVRFLYTIEDLNKLMTVEKYQVQPKSRDSQTAKCSMLVSKLVIPR
ncbi:MAG: type 4a pilus biogenesis protein PilO [Deltaproteobacteria bacterium]